jgi:putative DNA methylase
MKNRKKLIEVALPLEAINIASAREKSIRHGHPSTLHLWWARRPLAAARAVIFAQMVDDPSSHPDIFRTEKAQEKERQRLFKIIEDLVKWESTTNEEVLERARAEIWQSWRSACADYVDHPRAKELFDRHKLPAFHDPFAGGGALPLEAQRLGLESYASDLNPVAVLINKAMIEIPPKFAGRPPVNSESQLQSKQMQRTWDGVQGIAEDVRYYGQWMHDEAERRIGHLYPKIEVTSEMAEGRSDLKPYVGRKLTVIAWIWARTVKSPNPAFSHVEVPLASTFMLSTKPGKETFVEPVIEGDHYHFTVRVEKPKNEAAVRNGTKLSRGANFQCLMSDTPIESAHIYREATAGRMSSRLMAIAAEGDRGRVYLAPTEEMELIAQQARPEWKPDLEMPKNPRWFSPPLYGLTTYGDIFTSRQLTALATFSDLVVEARDRIRQDAIAAGLSDDSSLSPSGQGASSYAAAVGVYLACGISRSADFWSNLCIWSNQPKNELVTHLFGRQAIPMAWDFAEVNPFSDSGGNFSKNLDYVAMSVDYLPALGTGHACQADAALNQISADKVVSTDPPYYDNIGYADLSDYFYIWLRRSQQQVFPELFSTLAVPKAEELVATPYRHGGKEKAESFFLNGMTHAMQRLAEQAHPAFPVAIYYAFKQAESETDGGTASTGWETFLDAVIRAGFSISGTVPIHTERQGRMIGNGTNALASSIILVCRPRAAHAPLATRREFLIALKSELPEALKLLQRSNIAPVDLAQAAIGPGMGVFTRYAKVLGASGEPVSVRDALTLINQVLDEALAEQEGDFDAGTRWAVAWFEQSGFETGEYGVAETLSKAKNTSVAGMVGAKFLESRAGKVRLLRPDELPADWDPATDARLTAWEVVHQLIRVLEAGGEGAAADLVAKLGSKAEPARELAYRLYTICERKKRAPQALSYNALVQSWPEITRLAADAAKNVVQPQQGEFFS